MTAGDAELSSTAAASRDRADDIAIIGMACRFPGAANLREYWNVVRRGEPVLSEYPARRLVDGCRSAEPGGAARLLGGYLEAIDTFDAGFFGISDTEAQYLDPQQRLLLELAWETWENAAVPPAKLRGTNTGVFVGVSNHDFPVLLWPRAVHGYMTTGLATSVAANRVAHFLGLNGPSVVVDTACSSSLSAVHLACQSLRSGECSQALAGGCSLLTLPSVTASVDHAGLVSPTGLCRPFAEDADGYIRAEGAGMIALKRYADAVRDGDNIVAVIAGSAINHNGDSNGLTGPNPAAQLSLLTEAYRRSRIDPADIDYLEASASGSKIGDALEAKTILEFYSKGRAETHALRVGSSKKALGHLEGVSGIASIIKVALAIRHETMPRCLQNAPLSALIQLKGRPVCFPERDSAWQASGGRTRVAGISSFGFGGSNAHLVMTEAPAAAHDAVDRTRPYVLPISARTEQGFAELVAAYAESVRESAADVAALCHAAATGRDHFDVRHAFVADSAEELLAQLVRSPRAVDGAAFGRAAKPSLWLVMKGLGRVARELVATLERDNAGFRAELADVRRVAAERASMGAGYARSGTPRLDAALSDFVQEYGLTRFVGSLLPQVKGYVADGFSALAALVLARSMRIEEALDVVLGNAVLDEIELRPGGVPVLATRSDFGACDAERAVARVLRARLGESARRRCAGETRIGLCLDAPTWEESRVRIRAAAGIDHWHSLEDAAGLPQLVAGLYTRGVDIAWERYCGRRSGRRELPSYPFQRKRHWPAELGDRGSGVEAAPADVGVGLSGEPLDLPRSTERRFVYRFGAAASRRFGACKLLGKTVVTGASQISMALANLEDRSGAAQLCLRNVSLPEPLLIGERGTVAQLVLQPGAGSERGRCFVVARGAGEPGAAREWRTTLCADYQFGEPRKRRVRERNEVLVRERPAASTAATDRRVLAQLKASGYEVDLQDSWPLAAAASDDGELFWTRRTAAQSRAGAAHVAPQLLDSCVLALLASCGAPREGHVWVPISISRLELTTGLAEREDYAILVRPVERAATSFVADLTVATADSEVVLTANRAIFASVAKQDLENAWGDAPSISTSTARDLGVNGARSSVAVAAHFRTLLDSLLGRRTGEDAFAQPLCTLGIDSLKAMELRSKLRRQFGFDVSQAEILDGLTGARLISRIYEHVREAGGADDELHIGVDLQPQLIDFATAGTERIAQLQL